MRGSLESQFSFVIEGRKALSMTTFRFKSVEEIANKFAFTGVVVTILNHQAILA